MIIRRRRLLLNDRDPRSGLTLPIDMFLRSLAQDLGERAVAVILSGSGSDGSRGIQEISQAGGTVFCESPDSAQFNGMPLSAIRTGGGRSRPPARGDCRARSRRSPPASRRARRRCRPSEEKGVEAILRLLRDEYAHRLLALQGQHGHAPHRTAPRAQPVARHRHVRRAGAQRSARAQLALRGPADRRHPLLPRRRRLRRARAPHRPRAGRADRAPTSRSASGCPAARPARRPTRSRWCCTSGSARGAGRSTSRSSRPTSTRRRSRSRAPGIYTEEQVDGIGPRAARTLLHAQARRLPDLAGAARVHRLRPAQPDSRRAVHQDAT